MTGSFEERNPKGGDRQVVEVNQLHEPAFVASTLLRADAELVSACRKGDEEAWRELLNRFHKLICTIPRRAGLNDDQIKEVFQEVIITLYEKLNEIEHPDRLRSWIVTTTKHKTLKCLTQRRNTQRREVELEQETALNIPAESLLPDVALVETEEQHLVRVAFNSLEERCRKILTALFYEDEPRSYEEIANELGVKQTSISPLRARCLKRLLRLLTK